MLADRFLLPSRVPQLTSRTLAVPTWDEIIPFSFNGKNEISVIEQGSNLTFVTLEKGKQMHHSIPTTWVTYKFLKDDGRAEFFLSGLAAGGASSVTDQPHV
jgi:hypothetical protein